MKKEEQGDELARKENNFLPSAVSYITDLTDASLDELCIDRQIKIG